jgi:hypothetical protein
LLWLRLQFLSLKRYFTNLNKEFAILLYIFVFFSRNKLFKLATICLKCLILLKLKHWLIIRVTLLIIRNANDWSILLHYVCLFYLSHCFFETHVLRNCVIIVSLPSVFSLKLLFWRLWSNTMLSKCFFEFPLLIIFV